jgi:hypothetical protein
VTAAETSALLTAVRADVHHLERGASLVGAQPALLDGLQQLRAKLLERKITFYVADFGGLRTQAQTDQIMRYRASDWAVAIRNDPKLPTRTTIEKWRRIAPWGSSMHNYGAAFDIVIDTVPPGVTKAAALLVARQLAGSCGLTTISDDPPHFELPGGLAMQKVRYYAMTGQKFFAGFSTVETIGAIAVIGLLILLYILRARH